MTDLSKPHTVYLRDHDLTRNASGFLVLPEEAQMVPATKAQLALLPEQALFVTGSEICVIEIPAETWSRMQTAGIADLKQARRDHAAKMERGQITETPIGEIQDNGIKAQKTSAGRWWGWDYVYGKDKIYSTPLMLRAWIGRLRLHVFFRGDEDPDPHDHPWDFWTFPLRSYVEEVTETLVMTDEGWKHKPATWDRGTAHNVFKQVVPAFRLTYRPAMHTHRVLGRAIKMRVAARHGMQAHGLISHGGVAYTQVPGTVPTIVWRRKKSREWGFLKNRDGKWCWVAWKEYVFKDGKSAPCA